MQYQYCTVFLLVNIALVILVEGLYSNTSPQELIFRYIKAASIMWCGLWLLCQGALWITQYAADLHISLLVVHFCANVLTCYLSPMLDGAKNAVAIVMPFFVLSCILLTKHPQAKFIACKWVLPTMVLLTFTLSFCCERWSLPLQWMKWDITDNPSLYLRDYGSTMVYHAPTRVDWMLLEDELSITSMQEIPVYEEPVDDYAPTTQIDQATTYNLGELGFSYATVLSGWRYIPNNGYVKTQDLCRAFLKKQNILLRPLVRNNLFRSDIHAAENGLYLTHDYYRRYFPITTFLSLYFVILFFSLRAFLQHRLSGSEKE